MSNEEALAALKRLNLKFDSLATDASVKRADRKVWGTARAYVLAELRKLEEGK